MAAPFHNRRIGQQPVLCGLLLLGLLANPVLGRAADDPPEQFSDEIVAKAERILKEHGLRRVGSSIQHESQVNFAKLIAEETKLRRSLRQARDQWGQVQEAFQRLEKQFRQLEQQVGLWNAQFAAVGNADGRNNELVARINAGSAQLKQLARNLELAKAQLREERGELQDEEEAYAEHVLKMRSSVEAIRESMASAAEVRDVKIAYQVLATRYDTPKEPDVAMTVDPLDRRVRKLEESIFSEAIPLEEKRGGLMVHAVVGLEPVEMLVDSGASLVLLPQEIAEKANAVPAENPRQLSLVTADGRRIAAKEMVIPRIRIGKFEAKNVKAAVLDEDIPFSQPLLGLSFLERFRFEIDAAKKQLHLLQVGDTSD